MKLYGKTLLFKRGLSINIYLTMRCNLMCDFCCVMANRVRCEEMTLDEWKRWFTLFPHRIKEISMTGGEPTLTDYYPELCVWLLDRGIHISLATNLHHVTLNRDWPLLRIMPRYSFQVSATCHAEPEPFETTVRCLRALGYRVNVREVGTHMVKGSLVKREMGREELYSENTHSLHVAPDGTIYVNPHEMICHLARRNGDEYDYLGGRIISRTR